MKLDILCNIEDVENLKSLHTSLKNKIRGSQTYRVEVAF